MYCSRPPFLYRKIKDLLYGFKQDRGFESYEILLLYPPVLVRGSKMVRSDWTLPANQVAVVSIRLYLKLWVVFFKR